MVRVYDSSSRGCLMFFLESIRLLRGPSQSAEDKTEEREFEEKNSF